MKKKSLLLLIIICILSLCAFSGLLVYAFHIQSIKDLKETSKNNRSEVSTGTVKKITPAITSPAVTKTVTPAAVSKAPTKAAVRQVVLGLAGDVNLDENYYPVHKYDAEGKNILGCFSEDLLKEMKAADVMMLNNEFAYSTRGTKALDKSFTFRADPSRVEILKKMGVDIVSLANNHALDYGQDALLDTFDTLDKAGIDYAGAGKNLDRAKAPVYIEAGGRKIAFLAASRVVFSGSWFATGTNPGMIGTYNPAAILESIKEAKANSDYVVIFVHWGNERQNYPDTNQKTLARQYIDAGADAVIGCHPHVVQGFEYYKGKPIAYSLSNFWFNYNANKSALLKLYLDTDGSVKVQLRPVMNRDTYTYILTKDAEKKEYFDFMRKISFDVSIDENGYITDKK